MVVSRIYDHFPGLFWSIRVDMGVEHYWALRNISWLESP
jgi:hypothetical protein